MEFWNKYICCLYFVEFILNRDSYPLGISDCLATNFWVTITWVHIPTCTQCQVASAKANTILGCIKKYIKTCDSNMLSIISHVRSHLEYEAQLWASHCNTNISEMAEDSKVWDQISCLLTSILSMIGRQTMVIEEPSVLLGHS